MANADGESVLNPGDKKTRVRFVGSKPCLLTSLSACSTHAIFLRSDAFR